MRKIFQILSIIIPIIHSSANIIPNRLFSFSLKSIQNTFPEDYFGIIKRIYPNFFNDECKPEFTGFFNLLYIEIPKETEINLSCLNIERIPLPLAIKMKKVEKLNLSGNEKIKLSEKWFENFDENLIDLNLSDCDISDEDLNAIYKIKFTGE